MRQVEYSVAMSLDGYIAGPRGESDWILIDPDIDFNAIFARFDAILMGRKTYETTRASEGGSMPGVVCYVFSRTLRQSDCRSVTVSDNPSQTVSELKKQPGKDIWLFGGGELFRSMLELGLVDRVSIAIIPVLLGGGFRLLPDSPRRAELRLVKHQLYPKTGTMSLEYEVARKPARSKVSSDT
jgi:dihydrofolate reductase